MRAIATLAAALAVTMAWTTSADAADAYTIDPIDRVMTVAEPANVRTGPSPNYEVRVVLAAGAGVRVTGIVKDRDWLRVDLRGDGDEAFIYAPLLKEATTLARREAFGSDWTITENQPCRVWNNGMGDKYKRFTWSGACFSGKASGKGRLVWRSRFGKHVYEGFMLAGKLHGSGTLLRSDGSRYEGEWQDGMRHGRGIYKWAAGHRYEGAWSDDRPHGLGTAYFADGDVHQGQWSMGCYGERDGIWSALIATVEACGFE